MNIHMKALVQYSCDTSKLSKCRVLFPVLHLDVEEGLNTKIIGSLSNYDGDGNEIVIEKTNFTLILETTLLFSPTSSTCIMWPNYPGAESVRTVFKFI